MTILRRGRKLIQLLTQFTNRYFSTAICKIKFLCCLKLSDVYRVTMRNMKSSIREDIVKVYKATCFFSSKGQSVNAQLKFETYVCIGGAFQAIGIVRSRSLDTKN